MTSSRLEAVELKRRLADERDVAIGFGITAVVGDRLIGRRREFRVVLLERERGAGEQSGGAHGLAATLREAVEFLRRLPGAAAADVLVDLGKLFDLRFAPGPDAAATRCSRRSRRETARRPRSIRLPYFLKKSCIWSRRRFSSTSRLKDSLISGGCAKDVPQSTRWGIHMPVASLPYP